MVLLLGHDKFAIIKIIRKHRKMSMLYFIDGYSKKLLTLLFKLKYADNTTQIALKLK